MSTSQKKFQLTNEQIIDELRTALMLVMDQVDYTAGACTQTEMVGEVLPIHVIQSAKNALNRSA